MASVKKLIGFVLVVLLVVLVFGGGWVTGRLGIGSAVNPASLTELERQFAERMQKSTMVGYFTVTGREDRPLRPDRYDLSSVEKIGDNLWRFNTRMRHEQFDMTVPVAVPMQWIGDTPVIMMTDTAIPGVGTFTCRVLFYGDRYAGTWQHGNVGGHLFGRIEKQPSSASP
jgi:hypothetical protein